MKGSVDATETAATLSASPSSAATTGTIEGLGVPRSTVMRAIEAAVTPSTFEWRQETTMRDGTPKVEGGSVETIMGASLMGPPDDVIVIHVSGLAVASPEEAMVALAALRAVVPEAVAWWRGTFDGPPDYQTRAFGRTTVGWTRSTFLFDGLQSALFIMPTALMPTPTPSPTPRPTPPPPPDLLAYLPTTANGIPLTTTRRSVANLPDDEPCLPVCRWQVRALAKALDVDEAGIEVATSEPVGNESGPIDLAVIRIPGAHVPFLFVEWEAALRKTWPTLFIDSEDLGNGHWFQVIRERESALEERATAWYVRDLGNTLVIVSDADAQSWAYPPRLRVNEILEGLPTPQ